MGSYSAAEPTKTRPRVGGSSRVDAAEKGPCGRGSTSNHSASTRSYHGVSRRSSISTRRDFVKSTRTIKPSQGEAALPRGRNGRCVPAPRCYSDRHGHKHSLRRLAGADRRRGRGSPRCRSQVDLRGCPTQRDPAPPSRSSLPLLAPGDPPLARSLIAEAIPPSARRGTTLHWRSRTRGIATLNEGGTMSVRQRKWTDKQGRVRTT